MALSVTTAPLLFLPPATRSVWQGRMGAIRAADLSSDLAKKKMNRLK